MSDIVSVDELGFGNIPVDPVLCEIAGWWLDDFEEEGDDMNE